MRLQFHQPFPNKSEPSGCLIMDTLRYAAENETLKTFVFNSQNGMQVTQMRYVHTLK